MDSKKIKDFIKERKLKIARASKQRYEEIKNKNVIGYWIDEQGKVRWLNLIVKDHDENNWYMFYIQEPDKVNIYGAYPSSEIINVVSSSVAHIIESDFPDDLTKQLVVMRLEG